MSRRTAVLLPNVVGFPSVSMERYRSRLVDALAAEGADRWNFDILECDGNAPWQGLLPGFARNRIRGLYARWSAYPNLAKSRRGDIHHILDHSHATLGRATPPDRTVVTCHDLIPLLAARGELDVPIKPWIKKTFVWRLDAMRRAAAVVAISEATRRDLIERADFDPNRVFVAHMGIEPGFGPDPPGGVSRATEARTMRRSWNIPEDARVVLHVGTRNRYKNTPTVLKTIACLMESRADVWLVRIGAPLFEDENDLAKQLGVADRMVLPGSVDEATLRATYRAADVLLFPSLYEGFGWPPVEAMACGTPAVVGDRGALPEVVGAAAAVVDSMDERALANAVHALLDDSELAASRSADGRIQAARFTWRACALKVLDVYEGVADRAESASR